VKRLHAAVAVWVKERWPLASRCSRRQVTAWPNGSLAVTRDRLRGDLPAGQGQRELRPERRARVGTTLPPVGLLGLAERGGPPHASSGGLTAGQLRFSSGRRGTAAPDGPGARGQADRPVGAGGQGLAERLAQPVAHGGSRRRAFLSWIGLSPFARAATATA
jgi:hypothetical protein